MEEDGIVACADCFAKYVNNIIENLVNIPSNFAENVKIWRDFYVKIVIEMLGCVKMLLTKRFLCAIICNDNARRILPMRPRSVQGRAVSDLQIGEALQKNLKRSALS